MTTSRFTRELGGISPRLLQDYLTEAGATDFAEDGDDIGAGGAPEAGRTGVYTELSTDAPTSRASGGTVCHGTGWQARITALPEARLGSLRLKRLRLEVSGEPEPVEQVRLLLERKLIRIGG